MITTKTLLHIGCGPQTIQSLPTCFHDGKWAEIRYDIDPDVFPDIQGEMQDMSIIDDGRIDAIYSSHNIEHVHSFEVPVVFREFFRTLTDNGFAVITCPDIQSVAKAILEGAANHPLYISPAGPISAIDIMYGHQKSIEGGKTYMAHKTAFSAETLADALISSGFKRINVVRDNIFGLHSVAFKQRASEEDIEFFSSAVLPGEKMAIERLSFEGRD